MTHLLTLSNTSLYVTVPHCPHCKRRHEVIELTAHAEPWVNNQRYVTHRWECPSTRCRVACRPEDYPVVDAETLRFYQRGRHVA